MQKEWGGPEGFTIEYLRHLYGLRIEWGEDTEGMRPNKDGELPEGILIVDNRLNVVEDDSQRLS